MRHSLVLGVTLLMFSFGASSESAAQGRVALAPGESLPLLASLSSPCQVTIRAMNRSARSIAVNLDDSRVKTKKGLWQTLESAGSRGECASSSLGFPARAPAKRVTCTLEQACSQERRYKFKLTYDGNIVWAYYPSANGWTTDTDLNLGDIGRHFKRF